MKTLVKVILISFSCLTVYLHYLSNISSEIQVDLYKDLGSGQYRESTTARFNVLNLDFPNLSLTTLPMKGVVARYYYLGARYDEALDLLNQSKNDNPYIMYNESLKADIYYQLGVQDSLLFYAEKAFTGIPQNQKHFIDLSRAYNSFNDPIYYYKIDSIFKKVENTDVIDIWKFYFASVLTREDLISNFAKEKAALSLEKYKDLDDSQLKLSAKYVLFGRDKINKSLEIEKEGIDLFKNDRWLEAALKFEEAYKLDSSEYLHLENSAISNYRFGYYDKALTQLTEVINKFRPQSGQSEFVLAKIYYEKQEFQNACSFVRKSASFDFEESYRYIGEYCKKEN